MLLYYIGMTPVMVWSALYSVSAGPNQQLRHLVVMQYLVLRSELTPLSDKIAGVVTAIF